MLTIWGLIIMVVVTAAAIAKLPNGPQQPG